MRKTDSSERYQEFIREERMKEVYCKVNECPIIKPPLRGKELWYKVLDDKEYKIARSAWGFFLKAHGDECDMDGAIDTIAEAVLEIAERINKDIATALHNLRG